MGVGGVGGVGDEWKRWWKKGLWLEMVRRDGYKERMMGWWVGVEGWYCEMGKRMLNEVEWGRKLEEMEGWYGIEEGLGRGVWGVVGCIDYMGRGCYDELLMGLVLYEELNGYELKRVRRLLKEGRE